MVKFKGRKPKKSLMTELLFEGGFFLLSSFVRVIMIDGTQSKGEIPLKCLLNTKSLPRISTPAITNQLAFLNSQRSATESEP